MPPASPVTGKLEFDTKEDLADRLEQHRVEAELLEIKTQALKSVLQRNIQTIRQCESTPTAECEEVGRLKTRLRLIEQPQDDR